MRADQPLRVGIRCDAGPSVGVGHLVRCVALAEELLDRGHAVLFVGDVGGVAFAEQQLQVRGLQRQPAPAGAEGLLQLVTAAELDAVVLDSYVLDPAVSGALVAAGIPVLGIIDGDPRGLSAQLYLDQNIGAEGDPVQLPTGARRLAGTSYALLRDTVRSLRPATPRPASTAVPRVVVAYGGTDAYGMTTATVEALVRTGRPFEATVVTPDERVRQAVGSLARAGQTVQALPPFEDFPALLARADLVVGAAGTSAWEYCCLGLTAAVVAVIDNQYESYGRLVETGAVCGLGLREDVTADSAGLRRRLDLMLGDPAARQAIGVVAHGMVDGDGRVRVVRALEDLVASNR